MVQKAILKIDRSKGVKQSASAGSRFQTQNSVLAAAAGQLKKSATDTTKKAQAQNAAQNKALIKDGVISVQYNPASIRYHASTSTQKTAQPDVGSSTEMVTTITGKSTVDVSFQLVFHNVDDTDESVREQMELVMNMIYDSPTKKVTFAWGKIEMRGKLVAFSGEYDMFDAMGRPISGHMQLTIRTETTVKQIERTLDRLDEEHKDKLAKQEQEGNSTPGAAVTGEGTAG